MYPEIKDVAAASSEQQTIHSAVLNQHTLVELSLRYQVVPLTLDEEVLTIGISEQSDIQAVTALRFATGKNISVVWWEDERLQAALSGLSAKPFFDQLCLLEQNKQSVQQNPLPSTEWNDELDTRNESGSGPLVSFINHTLQTAVAKHASDIHFEPYGNSYRVRFRLDGVLQQSPFSPPPTLAASIAVRLKIISDLNIAEHRLPQEGRLTLTLPSNVKVALRISTLPTRWGEKVVLRLLDSHEDSLSVDQLGMSPCVKKSYCHALEQPQGLILITGPTGSGKTVTLYSGLQRLNTPQRNICTAEDPIEIPLVGINQLQTHVKAGLTFAQAMRAFLRQDPDVIMLGEIRDHETAAMAVKAAQTGHLVLSTLHTNSAIATLTRFMQLGVPRYQISAALKLIIAQRLVRLLCPYCRVAKKIDIETQQRYSLESALSLYQATGCARCHGGYQGRIGIYEALIITPEVNAEMLKGINEAALLKLAIEQGMETLQQNALQLVLKGCTSMDEMQRVLGA